MARRKRRKGFRLNDYIVERLPIKKRQYAVWDLTVQGCGVRISPTTKSCAITVWLGGKRSFETIGRVTPDTPDEYLRELAFKRIGELKRGRLPRAPLRQTLVPNTDTLRDVLAGYIAAHPQLRANTIKQYQGCLNRGFSAQMDQPVALLVTEEILRLNREHLEALTKKDRLHKPPIGFYGWQTDLRSLRAVLGWYAATKKSPRPWPDRKAPQDFLTPCAPITSRIADR